MRQNHQIDVAPQVGTPTKETGPGPSSLRVPPELRLAVLQHFEQLVQDHPGLTAVMRSLIAGNPGQAVGLLRMAQYGGPTVLAVDHSSLVERLVQAVMCPHHEFVFLELRTLIQGAASPGDTGPSSLVHSS